MTLKRWFGRGFYSRKAVGHYGFLDALRGSTTERVLREALYSRLAMPVTI